MNEDTATSLLALTSEIVSAHVANNSVHAGDVASLIGSVHAALSGLGAAALPAVEKPQGLVSARKSLADPEHILSMIDGKPYRSLTRHIGRHGHTPASYREAYDLPHDYPMTAPAYSEKRRALAHQIGLGRKPKPADAAPVSKRRGRQAMADALGAARGHLGGDAS